MVEKMVRREMDRGREFTDEDLMTTEEKKVLRCQEIYLKK